MSQASLFSALSASANLKANLGLNIKAPVLANLNLKGQANAQATSKVDVKAPIKVDVKAQVEEKVLTPIKETLKVMAGASLDLYKDIKIGAHAIKPQTWEADKGQYPVKEHKGFDKADKADIAEWKEGAHHKSGDTLILDQLKHKFEGHGHNQDQNQGDSQAAYQHATWQEPASHQPTHTTTWQAHGEATIELTGQVQHHDTAWHA